MPIELKLPDVGEGIAEGEIVRWLVAEGAQVKEDDLLVEILTDKANVELPSPVSGTLLKILAHARTGREGGGADRPHRARGWQKSAGSRAERFSRPRSSGSWRRTSGWSWARCHGSGPGGRITEEDVRRAAVPKAPAGAPAESTSEERIPFKGKRRMIARKMVAAKTRVPHALLVDEADVSGLLAERAKMRETGEREGVRITILPFIMKAVAGALQRAPRPQRLARRGPRGDRPQEEGRRRHGRGRRGTDWSSRSSATPTRNRSSNWPGRSNDCRRRPGRGPSPPGI